MHIYLPINKKTMFKEWTAGIEQEEGNHHRARNAFWLNATIIISVQRKKQAFYPKCVFSTGIC